MIRPNIVNLNQNFNDVAKQEISQSVDEQRIPFKGKHSLKVYMVRKPHKWGYKIWIRARQSEFVHEFEFYGDNKKSVVSNVPLEIGESGQIVIRFTRALPIGTYIFFSHNFSASSKPLVFLKNNGLFTTCTLHKDQTEYCSLKPEKEMKINGRGSIDYKVDKENNISVCQWIDNKLVTVASNIYSVDSKMKKKSNMTEKQNNTLKLTSQL